MSGKRLLAGLLVLGLLIPLVGADDTPAGDVIILRRCPIEYRYATNVGSPLASTLQDCLVQLGDPVKEGQVLGRLQDIEHQANLHVAEARFNLAATRVKTAEPLVATTAIKKDEMDILRGEMEADRHALAAAKAALKVRELISPHDGIVVAILKQKAESVNYGNDPVFRVVNPDLLRVTGYLDVPDAWRVKTGQTVRVTAESVATKMPITSEVFTGKVVFVDSEIDPTTQTCRIIAEVKNRDLLLRSGLEVRMEITLASNAAADRKPTVFPKE